MKKILVIGLVGESVFLNTSNFPDIGETIQANSIMKELGGKGFNQALTISKLGGDVTFISCVNSSDINYYKKETTTLSLNHYYISKNKPSTYACIETNKKGENKVIVYKGCDFELSDLDLLYTYIDSNDILLLQQEINPDITRYLIEYAKSKSKYIILNPSPISNTCIDVDLLVLNEIEAKYYLNFLNKNNTIIITKGSNGSTLYKDGLEKDFIAKKVDTVDTTGAGDVFLGSIAYFISNGDSIENAISKATINASISVCYPGVIQGIKKL